MEVQLFQWVPAMPALSGLVLAVVGYCLYYLFCFRILGGIGKYGVLVGLEFYHAQEFQHSVSL